MTSETRAIRNNNPLNLRPSRDKWEGLREVQTDPGYLQFTSNFYGLRAAAKNLLTYYRVHRRDTVLKIISAWAPPSDNNPTDSYVGTVCRALGVSPVTPINLDNGETLRRLMEVMIQVEAASQPFSRMDLETAITAAYASHSAAPRTPPVGDVSAPSPPFSPPPPDPAPAPAPVSPPIVPPRPVDQIVPPEKPPLVDQPSMAPTRKLIVGGSVGAVAFIVMAVWNRLFPSVPIPAEYATEIAGGVILGATLVTQYFTRNRATDIPPAAPTPAQIAVADTQTKGGS